MANSKLSDHYGFTKPNDVRALNLMNAAAQHTLRVLPDIVLAYGHSDEYSFVFHKSSTLFERRSAKIASTVVSTFTAAYVHLWSTFFLRGKNSTDEQDDSSSRLSSSRDVRLDLAHLPTFDSRTILYPSIGNLRDYLSWRQADCHINNLYNTTFWALVLLDSMSNVEAEGFLKGTLSADKNEILWSKFGINYNNESEIFRKGSVVFREYELEQVDQGASVVGELTMTLDEDEEHKSEKEVSKTRKERMKKAKQKAQIVVSHVDIIKEEFWAQRPWILSGKPGRLPARDTSKA